MINEKDLNQPIEIQLSNNRWIKNFYDGAGRLYKTTYSTGEYWEYLDGMVFKNGAFYQLASPEGRAVYQSGAWSYEYFHTDHLGNTRIAYKANGTALAKTSETSFDPWGIVLRDAGLVNTFQNRFEYQNKEKESTFNLRRIDFGARSYNGSIGRFDRVDPLADVSRRWSSYTFCYDNPIGFIDTNGMLASPLDDIYLNRSGQEIYRVKNDQPDRTFIVKTTDKQSDLYSPEQIKDGSAPAVSGISKSDAKATEASIKSGDVNNPLVQANTVQIENKAVMQQMQGVVSADNGKGGTSNANNREYGGAVNNGTITVESPGDVANPKFDSHAHLNITTTAITRAQYHSHPSGQIEEGPKQGNGTIVMSGQINTFSFTQPLSNIDIDNIGNRTGYVFGMSSNQVYIYNKTGVVASFPAKTLKK
ncbi:RHS repeat domain-containing protein [Emticicia soli]|uniref:RHS repeat domain-containing protein n=1 Tax=Emticicia soli TaxID=2027878 RepID=A0ABW5JB95_9BACT